MRSAIVFLSVLFCVVGSSAFASDDRDADFDFYLLALSWSPSYCAAEGRDASRQQCGIDKRYSFIVHGLWPQYERGAPRSCPSRFGRRTPGKLENSLFDIMPSRGLIRHQWRAHGTCSGLNQQDYFDNLRAARNAITIPKDYRGLDDFVMTAPRDVRSAFLEANPQLDTDSLYTTCDRRRLREVRICLTKDLKPRSCGGLQRRACKLPRVAMPPVRLSR